MQNKGAITLLAVALALVSLYQLFFTYKTNQVENAAKEFANGNPIKEKEYLDSVANQPIYNFLGRRSKELGKPQHGPRFQSSNRGGSEDESFQPERLRNPFWRGFRKNCPGSTTGIPSYFRYSRNERKDQSRSY